MTSNMLLNILKSLLILVVFSVNVVRGSPVASAGHEALTRQQKLEEILKYRNTSVDPCDDFYEFTCGNYGKYHKEAAEKYTQASTMYNLFWNHFDQVKSVLTTTTDNELDHKVQTFHTSCVERSKSFGDYGEKLKQFIGEFGQMPLLEGANWQESDFDWVKTIAHINYKTDVGIILDVTVAPDFADNTVNRAALIQPTFALQKQNRYLDELFANLRTVQKKNIQYYLTEFLAVKKDTAEQAAQEMFDFEIALARGMQDLDIVPPNELYNISSIDDMQEKYKSAWDSKQLFDKALDLYPSLVMVQHSYVQTVYDVIQKTPKRVVANYIFFTYLYELIKYIPQPSDICLSATIKHFTEYLEYRVYRKYYTEHHKEGNGFLWQHLKPAFEDMLVAKQLNWINDETRQEAVAKLKDMSLKISTYEEIDFERKYAKLNVSVHDFVANTYALLMLKGLEGRAKINQPPIFKMPPSEAPAYAPEENLVFVPVTDLQPHTVWSSSFPNAYNFGNLGSILGHEISHGFDDVGRLFDSKGNRRDWWNEASSQEFNRRVQCFATQYTNYTFRGVPLTGLERQGENIADNNGVRIAYKAYLKWYAQASKSEREMETFAGLDYTPKQLFFISYSQSMCSFKTDAYVYDNDGHVPENLRIIGALSNFEEFAKEFKCPLGSNMNRVKKCVMF